MKQYIYAALLACVLLGAGPVARPQEPPKAEKIAEGQYAEWKDGRLLKESLRLWSFWRTGDGYEMKVDWPVDPAKRMMWMLMTAQWKLLDPKTRAQLESATLTTGMRVELGKQMDFRSFEFVGRTFHQALTIAQGKAKPGDPVDIVLETCKTGSPDLRCDGLAGRMEWKEFAEPGLAYAYEFPLLFTPVLRQFTAGHPEPLAVSVAMLGQANEKLQLTGIPASLRREGREQLAVGDYRFDVQKYVLSLQGKWTGGQITLWATGDGMVFGLEDPQFLPGRRVLLSEYKKYGDF